MNNFILILLLLILAILNHGKDFVMVLIEECIGLTLFEDYIGEALL